MAIVFTITDAGRAALVDPDNDGTNAVTIAEIGFGTGRYTPAKDQTDLRSPIKRVDTIAGKTVANDTLHVTVQDETADAYSVGEIGLFTDAGVLFAVYSQSDWIIEKAAPATLLLATDLVMESLDVSRITFGDAAFLNPPATETVQGVIELATQAEVDAGKDGRRAVVPRTLKAFIDKVLKAYATVKQLADHAASRDHPGATTSAQGMVELATYGEAREGKDNSRALTPAADKAALDQHRTESGAHAGDRISLDSLKTLGNPKTVQAAFAALGSAALRNEGSGGGLDADKLDGLESGQFLRSDKGNTRVPFGTTSDTNWDGLVYDEGDNTVAFYADQTVGNDTPRALLGPGYIELAGRRIANSGAGIEFAHALGIGVTPNSSKAFTNGSSIALGNDDSGIRGDGDGVVEVWANNKAMLTVTTGGLKVAQGALEFPSGLYAEDGSTYAIDLANGDIVGANIIKWADESNNPIEGIAFPRNNNATDYSHFSTFRAYRDKPYFAPDASKSSYEMFHEGNLAASRRKDWGNWDTNGHNVILNSGRQVMYAADDYINLGGSDFSTINLQSLAAFVKGAKFSADINMQNNAITNVDRIIINDDGLAEGFMLPSYGFVQDSGNAYIYDTTNSNHVFGFYGSHSKSFKSLGIGADPGNDFDNGTALALADNDSGVRGVGDGQIEVWANNQRQMLVTKSTVRVDNELAITDCLIANNTGLHMYNLMDMHNKDIIGVNKIVINDDGTSEGFMLPSYGLVENSGNAYIVRTDSDHNYNGTAHARFDSNGEIYAYPSGSAKKVWHDGDSKRTSSYVVFPNGLIIQWGNASSNSGNSSVKTDFPIPFPNDCLIAIGCDNEDSYPDPVGIGWTRTQVSVTTDENGVSRYIAIGY